jgi:acyl carrier protein
MSTEAIIIDEIKSKTKSFLAKYIRRKKVEDDQDLFKTGLLNSLFAMQLVMFVEKEFKIKVENEDLDPKNFSTIQSIVGFVERKLSLLSKIEEN